MVGGERVTRPGESPAFQQPDLQELVDKELAPLQQYGIRMDDYLDQQMSQELSQLEQQYLSGVDKAGNPLSPAQMQVQQQQYQQLARSVQAKYDAEKDRILGLAQSGVMPEELPYYTESLDMWGGLTDWYNKRIPQLSEEFTANLPQQRSPYASPQPEPQGDPFGQYTAYTKSLNLAQPAEEWMFNNYSKLKFLWGGEGSFIGFVRQYLAGGRQ